MLWKLGPRFVCNIHMHTRKDGQYVVYSFVNAGLHTSFFHDHPQKTILTTPWLQTIPNSKCCLFALLLSSTVVG